MLNIACVKVGSLYGPDYVNTLFDMVRRNLPATCEGRFVCFTDDPTGLDPAISVKSVPLSLASRGWWAKLYLFSPEAFPAGERVLYFDLDTVITGPLDAIAAYDGTFSILDDAYRPQGWQSSVMAWRAGELDVIWSNWVNDGCPDIEGGDQIWIEQQFHADGWQPDSLQSSFPGKLRSYKVECRNQVPRGTSVVFFHGHPRPHEVNTGWVPEVWKIGGGSGLEFVVQANTSDDMLRAHVSDALLRNCQWLRPLPKHDRVALIVGGGPSLHDTLFYIHGMQLNGCKVFATNNTYAFLKERGIQPDAHVMVDAREDNLAFVPSDSVTKFYASQCHPRLLGAAGVDLICWHAHQPAYSDLVKAHPSGEIELGGGTTIGLRTIALAYALGYREFRLFGFDSCYQDTHHAYPQALNDGERTVTVHVAGKAYRCAPWMVSQAEEFKELICAMVNMECVVTVYGEGMLQAVAAEMSKTLAEVDGLYWPSTDQETRASVLGSLPDIEKFVEFCPRRKVAVQAGGNVGVFPKELAKRFERVLTFEPDAINWECLTRNVQEPNIMARHAALGDVPGSVAIEHNPFNPGASYITAGTEVDVITIDSLDLDACDLLQLDIEGYELKALKGAEKTIRKYSPVIVLEQKGLGDKYGDSDSDTTAWLHGLGYMRAGTAHRDVIYKRFS